MADEGDFIELLVASDRVEKWLETIRQENFNLSRVSQAAEELVRAVEASEAYAEEARLAGAVLVLTALLKRTDDEHLLELAADIIAACSGPMATANKVRTFRYEGVPVVLREGALGDGVGARIWTVAHTLCRELVAHPEMVRGQRVLEIGSGCGACGILAAKLGASEVLLTDYLDAILCNLRACMHLNSSSGGGAPAAAAAAAAGEGSGGESQQGEGDPEEEVEGDLFDPEDASECSDLDDFFGEAARGCRAGGRGQSPGAVGGARAEDDPSWEAGNMRVRFLDWSDSVAYLQRHDPAHPAQQAQQAQHAAEAHAAAKATGAAGAPGGAWASPLRRRSRDESAGGVENAAAASVAAAEGSLAQGGEAEAEAPAPGVGPEERFPVLLGTDILYEWPMVEMVACVLKHRLAPGGRALLCCAVREQAMFDAFAARLAELGLRVGTIPVQPRMDDGGILGKERDYEGGFVFMAVEHAGAPAPGWHRDDLFPECKQESPPGRSSGGRWLRQVDAEARLLRWLAAE